MRGLKVNKKFLTEKKVGSKIFAYDVYAESWDIAQIEATKKGLGKIIGEVVEEIDLNIDTSPGEFN